jgi:DNA processing protein
MNAPVLEPQDDAARDASGDGADTAERAAWLRLACTPGVGPATARELLATFGLPTQLFALPRALVAGRIGEAAARVLLAPPEASTRAAIEATEHWLAASARHRLLTLADAAYPQALLAMPDPPPVLYAIGRVDLLNRPALAIVGSRSASQQGAQTAEAFARRLAQAGLTIVSGLALGIDAAAHRGALSAAADGAAGSTIAVVGTGVDVVYPASNRELTTRVREHAVVISEFPLGTPPLSHNFPRRNRLIAGLARGVLVVEAALRSGSLITARLAAEMGREVFAVPGSIHSPMARGCHRLIRDGAKLVESAQDVLEELRFEPPASLSLSTTDDDERPAEPTGAALAQAPLLAALGHDPVDLDTLCARTGRTAGDLTAALLELELAQHVERLPGNRYQRLR